MNRILTFINEIKQKLKRGIDSYRQLPSLSKQLVKLQNGSIFQDETKRVRINLPSADYSKISKVHKIVLDINNMPMDNKDRDYYAMDIANIYQIAYKEEAAAEEYATSLKEIIEKNLLIRRKLQFVRPCVIGFGLIIISIVALIDRGYNLYALKPMLYGSLGGVVAVIINNNQFNIDYSVKTEYIKFESFKLIILSNIMAIIGRIAIDSKFILSSLDIASNEYMMFLVYIICGFSQTFVPSILKNFEKDNV